MELYGPEQKSLKKRDKEAYYYDDEGNFIKVPGMFDSKDKVFTFIMACTSRSIPGITREMIQEVWEEAEEKKAIIIDALEQLKREHESTADYFKSAAYGRAIPQIQKLQVPLLSGVQAQKIKGIGKGIASHIDEILRAGKLKSVEEREKGKLERQKVIELFTKIWGVTPKVAGEWYTQGLRTVEDLKDAELNDQQRLGIKYYEEIKELIPRDEVTAIVNAIRDELDNNFGITNVDVTGDYRRDAPEVNVVDLVISIDPDSQKLGKGLLRKIVEGVSIITDAPVFGSNKFMGIVMAPGEEMHRRIDIMIVPSNARGTVLLHTTGPDAFVRHLKELASQKGYKMNEYGLFKLTTSDAEDEQIATPYEEDVFETLGIPYIPSEDRF